MQVQPAPLKAPAGPVVPETLDAPEGFELSEIVTYLKQPAVKRAVVTRVNAWVDIPIIPEPLEATIFGAVYDGLIWALDWYAK